MAGELVLKQQSRLFLFEALQFGLDNRIFDSSILQAMQKEGAEMTVRLASKYYQLHYEECLKRAMKIILGATNFGLLNLSGGDITKAAQIIKDQGLVKMFRQTWSEIERWKQRGHAREQLHDYEKKDSSEVEKEMLEALIFENEWSSDDFNNLISSYRLNFAESELSQWVNQFYHGDKGSNNTNNIDTFFMSLLISKTPYFPFRETSVEKLTNIISAQDGIAKLRNKIFLYRPSIPRDLLPAFDLHAECLLDRLSRIEKTDMMDWILNNTIHDITAVSAESYAYKNQLNILRKEPTPSLIKLLCNDTMTHHINRIVAINLLIQRGPGEEELLAIIKTGDKYREYWQGKIPWHNISWLTIKKVVDQSEEYCYYGDLISDVMAMGYAKVDKDWWRAMPIKWVHWIIRHNGLKNLYGRKFISISELKENYKSDRLLFLLPENQLIDYWHKAKNRRSIPDILMRVGSKELNWSEEEAFIKVCNFASLLISRLSNARDIVKSDPIFIDEEIRNMFRCCLSEKNFKRLGKKIKEEMANNK